MPNLEEVVYVHAPMLNAPLFTALEAGVAFRGL